MQHDPYDVGYAPGKFLTTYVGREAGYYVVRVHQRGHKGLDACMMDRDLFDWLFEEVGPAQFHMMKSGAQHDAECPCLMLCEGRDGHDTDILFRRFAHVIAFDQRFGVKSIRRLMAGK